jgi:hypothetical protein
LVIIIHLFGFVLSVLIFWQPTKWKTAGKTFLPDRSKTLLLKINCNSIKWPRKDLTSVPGLSINREQADCGG